MNFCQEHWDMLKAAIEERGLSSLVAPDGETAVMQLKDQLESEGSTPTNYDPLMSAMFAISNNAMDLVSSSGGNPLYFIAGKDNEQPLEIPEGFTYSGDKKTWPVCPLCHINLAHEIFCRVPDCTMDRVRGYDHWIDRAADDQVEAAKELGLRE